MMSQTFVCFTGLDGSGKSTLTKKTYENFQSRNIKVKKIYGRYLPIVMKLFMFLGKKIFLKNVNMFKDYDAYLIKKKSAIQKKTKLSQLYMGLLNLEYFIELLFKITIPYKMGYSIISDRYIYDTIINDVAIDRGLSTDEINSLLETFWSFVPKPDIVFFVEISEQVAFSRKKDIPSLSYLKIRNEWYQKMAAHENMIVLDGTTSFLELEKKILVEINKITK